MSSLTEGNEEVEEDRLWERWRNEYEKKGKVEEEEKQKEEYRKRRKQGIGCKK